MFSFHELTIDPDLFYGKSQDIKALSRIEKLVASIPDNLIENSTSEAIDLLSSNHTCSYVFAKTLFKFCLYHPKHIEKYLLFLHKIKTTEKSLFKNFRRILFIEYKTQDDAMKGKNNKVRPEIIFILNKLIEMKDLKPNELIHSRIHKHLQFIHYYDNSQMKEILKTSSIEFQTSLEELMNNEWSLHLKYLSEGHHQNQAIKSIEIDDVNTLTTLIGNKAIDKDDFVPYSIYQRFQTPFEKVTLIEYAAFCSSIECFKYLLLNEAKLTENLPICAVCGGNTEIIHICEQNNLEFKNEVDYALQYHHSEIFLWLIETKNQEFPKMNSFLESCVKYSLYSFLIDYLPKCTRINDLMMVAIKDGNNLLYTFLKQFKEIRFSSELEVLEIACQNGNFELFRFFNRNKFNRTKFLSLFLLHKSTYSESEDIVQLLLNRKEIDIDQKDDKNGQTAFHIACQNSSHEVSRILMNHYCDINAQCNKKGYTGLHFACENGHLKIINIILEQLNLMVDIKDKINYETPLHIASRRGFQEIVLLLLKKGFWINEISRCYMRPLHFACMNGNLTTVDTLISFDPENIDLNSGTILIFFF